MLGKVFAVKQDDHSCSNERMVGGMAPKPSPIYVLRLKKWVVVTTRDLLPGDIISLAYKRGGKSNTSDEDSRVPTARSEVVPCDCIMLSGSAVVNEASLTGYNCY
jgi:cation-transporting ATPase 13A1